ncbi:MAG: helix-turn-helix domain-containing protein [Acidimicrobiia bacterium]|nr:helix-turn-helix domain-containing protein [Acidimicrobiia bacterium]MCY4458376.1 helix-turn-helix domain-containing protein [Acidimicrobiaceae bacterium]
MAQRLCFDEQTRIEVMCEAQLSVAVVADRLGRDRSTMHRGLTRGGRFEHLTSPQAAPRPRHR